MLKLPGAMRRLAAQEPRRADALTVALVGLSLRLGCVLWARGRFPPIDDGHFYQLVAERIARGQGYTWLWPDGAVTYAAHYPVGYPALLGVAYALFGAKPLVAMLFNALLGSIAVYAAHRLAASSGNRAAALLAGLLVAADPSLVLYTPALMTEGVAAALVLVGAWAASAASRHRLALPIAALVLGLSILVRPQLLLLVPLLGLIASPSQTALLPRVRRALLLTALSVAVCLPWTARNCARLESCVLVSANGGWNLFIGTAREGGGGWVPLDRIGVPEECKTVFGEAEKDACFGRAGLRRIAAEPLAWLSLVPAKLKMTFDYSGAAAYYLHASNGEAFSERARALLGGIEVGYQRLLALLGLVALARVPGQHARPRRALALLGAVGLLLPLAWLSHLASCGSALLLGAALWRHPAALTAAAVVATASLVHAIFFGAGRYGLVVTGAMAALAGLVAGCRAEMKLASDRAF